MKTRINKLVTDAKVGESVIINGLRYDIQKAIDGCHNCALFVIDSKKESHQCKHIRLCQSIYRKDGKSVIFKKINI